MYIFEILFSVFGNIQAQFHNFIKAETVCNTCLPTGMFGLYDIVETKF